MAPHTKYITVLSSDLIKIAMLNYYYTTFKLLQFAFVCPDDEGNLVKPGAL